MINFNDVKKEEKKERNPNCLKISNPPYRILIIEGSGLG